MGGRKVTSGYLCFDTGLVTPFIGRTDVPDRQRPAPDENAATSQCICYKTNMRPYFPSHFAAASSIFHSLPIDRLDPVNRCSGASRLRHVLPVPAYAKRIHISS